MLKEFLLAATERNCLHTSVFLPVEFALKSLRNLLFGGV